MMNAFRNLYRIRNEKHEHVAFVTAGDANAAAFKYYENGGNAHNAIAEQMSHGYPHDVCDIDR